MNVKISSRLRVLFEKILGAWGNEMKQEPRRSFAPGDYNCELGCAKVDFDKLMKELDALEAKALEQMRYWWCEDILYAAPDCPNPWNPVTIGHWNMDVVDVNGKRTGKVVSFPMDDENHRYCPRCGKARPDIIR